MDTMTVLKEAAAACASDIFVVAGRPISMKCANVLQNYDDTRMLPDDTMKFAKDIYDYAGRDMEKFLERGDDDFSFSVKGVARFRMNAYKQRGSVATVIRVVAFSLPDPQKLGITEQVLSQVDRAKGLLIVSGPAGCGKSTTLACMIDRINHSRSANIITLEDPIEYLFSHDKSIISQREISIDTENYLVAVRAALRQAPDVIFLGELRDYETISVAMTAAETGHLVISSLHTLGAANTVDRIVDVFPAVQQEQIRTQLAMVLSAVISQQLVPTLDGKVAPAFEILKVNDAVSNIIRQNKAHQIDSIISASSAEGMISMDASLLALYKAGRISRDTAMKYCVMPDMMKRKLQ